MAIYATLIRVAQLQELRQGSGRLVILDCGFDLSDPELGRFAYEALHIPGAQYANLDLQLAAPKHPAGPLSPAFTGRHPLPDRTSFARQMGDWGIDADTQVVLYDDQAGPYASRAWWMMRWMGHAAAAVLDGGKAAWRAAGGGFTSDVPPPDPRPPYPASASGAMPVIDADELLRTLGTKLLIDGRNAQRWRGEVEVLDPVAGRIPGSMLRFFKDNLTRDARFKPVDELCSAFAEMGARPGHPVVHLCGSGVTACLNLLAMEHAGLDSGALYVGSWSEWCADPSRPKAIG